MIETEILLKVMLLVLILSLILVGGYLLMVLKQLYKLLDKFNKTFDTADTQLQKITSTLQSLSGFSAAFQAGIKTIESIREHLAERKKE